MRSYVKDFERLGFGLFVHFGLYSILGRGEWAKEIHKIPDEPYEKLIEEFNPVSSWAKDLVKTAKNAGCKYITLTTRHHDGFSLYDTKGLSDYDAVHAKAGRDLIKEFVDACREEDIMPIFYHTLLDWHEKSYKTDFSAYIEYLIKSIEILCTSYGKIGGFWFDGMWDKKTADWQEDRIYSTIRKYQPTAMIINNTGLSSQGKVGHVELDSVTFERGKPKFVDNSDRPRAGEMCQVLNDHWGYAEDDCNYKSVRELIENLIDCRKFGCNFLLNTGLKGDGSVNITDGALLGEIGKWIKRNKYFIYNVKPSEIQMENVAILKDEQYYYAVIKNVAMSADPNVALSSRTTSVTFERAIKNAVWLDSEKAVCVDGTALSVQPFSYGSSLTARVIRFEWSE